MARQVQLTLEVTEWVRLGEKVFVKAKAKGARWFGEKKYFFAGDTKVYSTGPNTGWMSTNGLEPGTYLVKAHFEQGLDQADAAATFTVVE